MTKPIITALVLILSTFANLNAQNGWRMEGGNASRTNVSPAPGPTSLPAFRVVATYVSGTVTRIADDGSVILTDGTFVSSYTTQGQLQWRTNVADGLGGRVVDVALASSGTVYVSSARTLVALDPFTGQPSWPTPFVANSGDESGPLVVSSDGTVYFHTGATAAGTPERFTAINADGTRKWEFLGNSGRGSGRAVLSTDGLTIYLYQLRSGGLAKAVGLSSLTGQVVSDTPCDVRNGIYGYSSSNILYTGTISNNLLTSPSNLRSCQVSTSGSTVMDTAAILNSGLVAVQVPLPGTGSSYAMIDSQGRTAWSQLEPLRGGFADTPASEGSGTFYAIAPHTNEVVAIRAATGEERWRQRFPSAISGLLLGGNGNLFVVSGSDLFRSDSPLSKAALTDASPRPSTRTSSLASRDTASLRTFAATAPGLVAAFGFSEGTSSTTVDASGNGFNGTLANGAAWTAGKNGNGLSFDGIDDKVMLPNTLDIPAVPFTLEAWVKPTNFADYGAFFSKRDAAYSSQMRFDVGFAINTGRFYVVTDYLSITYFTYVPPLNIWTHLAINADSTATTLYVNGVLQETRPAITLGNDSAAAVTIGGSADDDDHFAGSIDDLRLYSRALTQAEILTDMNTAVASSVAPVLTITQPAAGSSITGSTVNVTYTASGDLTEVNHVHFTLDSNPEVMDMTLDGVYQFTNVATGNHVLNGYLVRVDHSKILGTDATPVSFSTTVPDTTPPTATLTGPLNLSTVTGSISVTATASDNVGVAGVQFLLDGQSLGSEDTSTPYSITWNTTLAMNGAHTLAARARDLASNLGTSTSISVTVSNSNPNDPAIVGLWSTPSVWPLVPVHLNVLPTGQVLAWDNSIDHANHLNAAVVWDPITGVFTDVTNPAVNLFCAGQTQLADGKIIVVGGHIDNDIGINAVTVFDPFTLMWTSKTPMSSARWYPGATTLADGRVLALVGTTNCKDCIAGTPEVYNPATDSWQTLTGATSAFARYYPHSFVLPDGRVLVAGTSQVANVSQFSIPSRILDVNTQTWTTVDAGTNAEGLSVMYQPGKIVRIGGTWDDGFGFPLNGTAVLDMTAPTPAWRSTTPMQFARVLHNLTILPDGSVLTTGGSTDAALNPPANSVLYGAELWNPSTETWTTLSSMQTPRLYHSTTALLPDGRVLVAGGGRAFTTDQFNAEIYSPPYLFKGARPTITSAPGQSNYGSTIFVSTPNGAQIASVSLVRPTSVTHTTNFNQRFVPLTFQQVTGGLNVTIPANGNVAPPGYYMLFIVDGNGVPSVASFIRLDLGSTPDTTAPTTPTNLLGAGAGVSQVNLTWTASTDNVAVTGYTIERCQGIGCSNFAPVGTSTSASYSNTGLASSTTYNYRVRATDAAGNLSGYSNVAPATTLSDTTAPTAPSTLTATAAGAGQINLAWAASTDNVGVTGYRIERCTGAGCSNFTEVAISTSASYSDTGLAASTTYSYRVRATDAAANLSGYSNVATATTSAVADTTAATPPSNLAATAAGANQINMTWTASTDNVGVTGYRIERCVGAGCANFAQVATSIGAFYNDTGLTPATTYSYRVRATDAAGNLSGYSNVAAATTSSAQSALAALAASMGPGSWAELTTNNVNPALAQTGGITGTTLSYSDTAVWDPVTQQFFFLGGDHDPISPSKCPRFVSYKESTNTWQLLPTANWFQCGAVSRMHGMNHTAIDAANGKLYHRPFGDMVVRKYDIASQTWTNLPAIPTSVMGYNQCCTALAWFPERNSLVYASIENGTNGAVVEYSETTGQWIRLAGNLPIGPWQNFMKYDPVDRVVLFGGGEGDTHLYKLDVAGQVTALRDAPIGLGILDTVVSADPVTGKFLVFGVANDFWVYDVTTDTWTLQTGGTTPPILNAPVYDGSPVHGVVVAPVSTYGINMFAKCYIDDCHVYLYKHASTDTTPPVISAVSTSNITTTGATVTWTTNEAADSQVEYGITAAYGQTTSLNPTFLTAHSVAISGLSSNTTYHFMAKSRDGSGNLSTSGDVTFTTAPPDSIAPTAPTLLTAIPISSSQIDLTWTAATDNVAVTGYRLERCLGAGCTTFVQVATPAGTTQSDTGLAGSTSYSYRVRATDAAGNLSGYSNVANAITFITPPLTGLVAAYSFNEGSGTTVADASGNGNAGTIAAATWTTNGKYGNTLTFNGSSARVTVADAASLHLITGMTLEAWVFPTAAPSGWRDIIYKQNDIYQLEASSTIASAPTGAGTFGDGWKSMTGISPLPVNTWTHVALTFDGANLTLWVNGVTVATQVQTSPLNISTLPLQIGGDSLYGQGFAGRIDEVRVYNRALTRTELEVDMNTPVGTLADATPPAAPVNPRAFAGGTPAAIIARQGYINSTSVTTHTTAAINSTGGDLILVFASSHEGVGTLTLSDNKANTWITAVGPTNHPSAAADLRSQLWYAKTPNVGTGHTMTLSLSSADSAVISVFVIKGANTTAPLDVTSSITFDSGTAGTSITSAAINTTYPADLLIDFAKSSIGATWTAGTGYTFESAASSNYLAAEDAIAGTAGSYTAGWTMAPALNWHNVITSVVSANASASDTQITTTWNPSTDNIGVVGYVIERCTGSACSNFAAVGSTAGFSTLSYTDAGLASGTTYMYRIRGKDAAGNFGAYTSPVSAATTGSGDSTAPTAPSSLTATAAGMSQINLAWTASTDNVGVTGYRIERCQGTGCTSFGEIGTSATASYSDSGLAAGTSYVYRVRANDAAGNLSGYSNTAGATTTTDTAAPSAPSNLTATAASMSQINLVWTASTDNVGVTGYRIERCQGTGCTSFAEIGNSTTESYSDSGLASGTSYAYRIRATDAAGNLSGYSNTASATTSTDTIAPSAPSNLTATAAGMSAINLAWTASTDNVGVTGYKIERCQGTGCTSFAEIGTSPTASYSDSGLTLGTSYAYRVRANDAAGNLSVYSNTASATTSTDTVAPSAPSNLTATAAGLNQINLAWTASTDNVGVTGYKIERCQGTGCSSFAEIGTSATASYSDSGLASGTNYQYRVRATDAAGNLGGYSNTAGATTSTDSVAPSAPSTLTATASGGTQVNLSWTASTDNVGVTAYLLERCQGAGCSSFTQIASPATPTYVDNTVAAGTSYSYRVRATDAAGNLSGYSNTASATTADTVAPSAPSNLTATASGGTQVNLSWTASTDNVGVTAYLLERCQGAGCSSFAWIASPIAATYVDNAVAAGSSYSYRVRGTDAAGNISGYSNTASAATTDTIAPSAPSNLTATASSDTQVNLSWTASTDNVGVTGYLVERCQGAACSSFAQIASPVATTYSDSALTAGTSYSYRVRATDAAGNHSGYSNTASATTTDTVAPSAPSNLTTTAASGTQINLSWTASTDNVGVTAYLVERCQGAGCSSFAQIASPAGTTYSDSTLTSGTSYSYRVRATDAAGNLGGYSNISSATTIDTVAPSAPSNLTATASGDTQVNLSWTASTDNVGVTGYLVERCQGAGCSSFAQIASPTATTYVDNTVAAGTSYSYRVRATDAGSNLSGYSNTSSATTTDTAAPSAPSNLTAAASGDTQVNLSWTASTDNVAVTGYLVERCQGAGCSSFAQIASPTGTTYVDNTVAASTSYSYRVRATDAASNLGGYSNTATLTTPDTTPPSAPSTVTAAAVSTSQINLAWSASTDNVGVTGYRIERCQGAGCSSFAQIGTSTTLSYSDAGLSPATIYSYRVRATDAGGNLSGYSNTASTATDTPPTAPSTLTATAAGATQINLAWAASTSSLGISNYLLERCQGAGCSNFVQVATSTTITYSDTSLALATTYSYRVRAVDAHSNLGGYSNTASATTTDTFAPSVPSNLTSIAISDTQINLTWTASTDNVGVIGYRVERCQGVGCSTFAEIATPAGTSYNNTGLVGSTSYSYRVRATDAAGNLSGYSSVATATTLVTPPSGPILALAFNEGTGTATGDASGSGFNGTLVNGPVWTAGKNGNAISFDGTDDKVSLPSSLDISALPFTLEAWIRPTSFAKYRVIFSKRATPSVSGMRFDVGLARSSGRIYVNTISQNFFFIYDTPLNTWTHIAVVAQSTGTALYVNGVLQETHGPVTLGIAATAPVNIGRTGDNDDPFAGAIDDLRLYNRALSQVEIQTDMNTPVVP